MFVYVRNQDGKPLMPCSPAKARKLLRSGKARVVKRSPFTIQLNWLCEGLEQLTKLLDYALLLVTFDAHETHPIA